MQDLTKATATELSQLYASGSVTPVTVAQQLLDRIARLNPQLNAFCFIDANTTLMQAQASADRWRQGRQLSVLDGIPVAIKDSILTQGWPTLHASRAVDPGQPWLEDAPAVARLREAGAVFVGKTTMSEFGSTELNSDSLLYGNVYNPWNKQCTTGGSSGGSCVAVAAGLVPVALGTDFGGSVSVPSTFCGTFAIKPTFGKIPHYPVDAFESSTVGVVARSPADLALFVNCVSQPDLRDSTSLPYSSVEHLHGTTNGLRVAYWRRSTNYPIDDEINATVDRVANWLTLQGADVNVIEVDIKPAIDIFVKTLPDRFQYQWQTIPEHLRSLSGRAIQHRSLPSQHQINWYALNNQRNKLIADIDQLMQTYDIILSPVTTISSNQLHSDLTFISPWSIFYCMTKQPTATVPVGLNSKQTPEAILIAGARHADTQILQLATILQTGFAMPLCPVTNS